MRPLTTLLRRFAELHPEDAAHAFEMLPEAEALKLLKSLPIHVAITLLERLSPHAAAPLLDKLESERLGQIVTQMPPRSGAEVLNQLDDERRDAVFAELPESQSRQLREILLHSADTAGGIMEPQVASLAIDLTVQKAITSLRKAPRDFLYYLYVTGRDRTLIGVLSMRDLLLASPRDPIEPLVNRNVLSVSSTTPSEEVVSVMRERKLLAIPVVDFDGRLVGIVKHDEALQAGQEEAFEDLQRIVGAGADERALSPISTVVKSRLPWLYVNLGTAFMAAAIVGLFEGIIADIAALAVLLPVVAGQGGNTGSQALAVVMRGLALREVVPGVKRKVVMKEFLAGTANGVLIALGTSAAVFGWRMLKQDSLSTAVALSAVIGVAMVINMGIAALSGATIPMMLRALGRDPAQSSGIFLTTVTDIVGFASFLGLAAMFMSYLK